MIDKHKFGDIVYLGLAKGVVVDVVTKRKWTYYEVLFEGAEGIGDDWGHEGRETEIVREDKL